ncbi:FAD-binding domain-containing protein [Wilcoxina mikolae CBS 423.85]|nr:FAD-binding domain-containing protein [Wilcoxina mikolae CBS 423.85]
MARFSILTAVLAATVTTLVNGQDHTGACAALSKAYPSDTEFPSTPSYTALNTYWAANLAQTPYCIFTPRSASSAAFALKTLKSHNTIFAIRSGGHSFNPGFSSTSRGVVINLSLLNQITVDTSTFTAKIGPGNTWDAVYRALEPYHATIAGGRAAPVGVGGFTLGGGLSFYLYEYGFGADMVVEYEVVTAAGEVLTVNKSSHPELFVALKGSGAPFCLVTRFTFKMIPVSPRGIYGGVLVSGNKTIPGTLDALSEFMTPGHGTSDVKSHLITMMLMSYSNTTRTALKFAMSACFYQDPVSTTPAVYKPLLAAAEKELWNNTLVGGKSVAGFVEELQGLTEGNGEGRQAGIPWAVVDPSANVVKGMEKIWDQAWSGVVGGGEVKGLVGSVFFIPMGQQGRGENVLGLERGKEYLQVMMMAAWTRKEDDQKVRALLLKVYKEMVEYVKREGQYSPWIYLNYALDAQDPIASYGEGNVEKLRKVQEKYDPDRVWEKLVNGGFKIPKKK